eukprot:1157212-Pelagomonas_calceolata.AAC.2
MSKSATCGVLKQRISAFKREVACQWLNCIRAGGLNKTYEALSQGCWPDLLGPCCIQCTPFPTEGNGQRRRPWNRFAWFNLLPRLLMGKSTRLLLLLQMVKSAEQHTASCYRAAHWPVLQHGQGPLLIFIAPLVTMGVDLQPGRLADRLVTVG